MRRGKRYPADRLEFARQRVVAAFADHWRRLAHSRSRRDIAKKRAAYFFAGSTSVENRLARIFYGREHARKMASLSPQAIRETLSPWLEHAVRYWADKQSDSGGIVLLPDYFLAELPTAEYVSIIRPHKSFTKGLLIDRYPGERVGYDDLYERMCAGYSVGAILRIYKATGEPFTPFEARSARAGIRRDILEGMASAGDDDPWTLNTHHDGSWGNEGFEGEDFNRVVFTEANLSAVNAAEKTRRLSHACRWII